MPRHYLGLFRHHAPFPADVVERTLAILGRRLPGFFPAQIPGAPARSIHVASPADYDPAKLPGSLALQSGTGQWIPIHGGDGSKLEIVDDGAPGETAARVLLWLAPALPPVGALESLLRELIESLEPDAAWLTDDETPIEHDIDDVYGWSEGTDSSKVPPALYWLTWLNPALIRAAGPAAITRLSALCRVQPAAGGLIVRAQEAPTRGTDRDWTARREAVEAVFGLDALHRRFPRRETPQA